MAVWAIADLHLSFGIPSKQMDIFGPNWVNHAEKIRSHWERLIQPEDLVLIAGDISWAMRWEDALVDLNWVHNLPGTKVLLRGNHDYWWTSLSKMAKELPSSLHLIQNNAFNWKGLSIGGARLWDSLEYSFKKYIEITPTTSKKTISPEASSQEEEEKIFLRELQRLELSLKALDMQSSMRIVMTHYPPIGNDLQPSRVSVLLEKYNVNLCVFGHLHSLKRGLSLFGEKNHIRYILTACDYLDFVPVKVVD